MAGAATQQVRPKTRQWTALPTQAGLRSITVVVQMTHGGHLNQLRLQGASATAAPGGRWTAPGSSAENREEPCGHLGPPLRPVPRGWAGFGSVLPTPTEDRISGSSLSTPGPGPAEGGPPLEALGGTATRLRTLAVSPSQRRGSGQGEGEGPWKCS